MNYRILLLPVFLAVFNGTIISGQVSAAEPAHTQSTHTGWIHHGCVAFKDLDSVISKGPVTSVSVSNGGFIHGLQLGYGGHQGTFHGFTGRKIPVAKWEVPPGEFIVKAEGHIAGYYISRLQFTTNTGKKSPQFGGKKGKAFTTANPQGLPLRTISGHANLRRHRSLNRAIASLTFHFSDQPVSQPSVAVVGKVRMEARKLTPFYLNGKTYILGRRGRLESPGISYDANWWVINDDPATGFTPVVRKAKMSSSYRVVDAFTLTNHPYIFGLHEGSGDHNAKIWRINDDAGGFTLLVKKGKMSPNYFDNRFVSFQLKGKPYLLGVHVRVGTAKKSSGTMIWTIEEAQNGVKLRLVKYGAPEIHSTHLQVFYLDDHPYIFGVHKTGAMILRIKDDPSQGFERVMAREKFHQDYRFVRPFHLNGQPYLFAATHGKVKTEPLLIPTLPAGRLDCISFGLTVGEIVKGLTKSAWGIHEVGDANAIVWKIKGGPGAFSLERTTPHGVAISGDYGDMVAFEQGGKAYIFGVKKGHGVIRRVNDEGIGFSMIHTGQP